MEENSTILKDNLVKSVQNQIDVIMEYYEKMIEQLKSEKNMLENEVENYKIKLMNTEKQLDEALRNNKQDQKSETRDIQVTGTFDSKMENIFQLAKQERYEECESYLELILNDFLVKKLYDKKEITDYFQNKILNAKFFDINHPSIVIQLAKLYFHSDLYDHLLKLLKLVFSKSVYIDGKLDNGQYYRLLWYSYFLGEQKMMESLFKSSEKLLNFPVPEAEIYKLFNKKIENQEDLIKRGNILNNLKERCKIFTQHEISKLFNSLENRVAKKSKNFVVPNPLSNNATLDHANVRKVYYVTKLPTEKPALPDSGKSLQQEWIKLAVFKDVYLKEYEGYTSIKVYSYKNQGKAYVTETIIKEIRNMIGNRWIDVRAYQGEDKVEKNLRKNEISSNLFAWPSTELTGTNHDSEKLLFNEESELKKHGYQITGLSRDKRWSILENAVKSLGLKKVAYTIAQNVKLRKGQKNGLDKFSYSIGEWEYDLAKLKQQYYKNNFTWPSTKIK